MTIPRAMLIGFAGLLLAALTVAQERSPQPPPPPLIYSAPSDADLVEFSDPSGSFKATFPGRPTEVVHNSGSIQERHYTVVRSGSMTRVIVLEFQDTIESRSSEILGNLRKNVSSLTRNPPKELGENPGKITVETVSEINGQTFDLLGYESTMFFTHLAFHITGKKLYVISTDVTNWHILKQFHPKIVNNFNSEADRFLRSFAIAK
ncbi:hypothetical protein [Leptolyngbya sp. 7M]|uniref:hypothetical protein n=1 Tax=Leptolyngbya sp. 7M TaxID=2812896 RepID=UPI001B8C2990|nr:hypothetical protein [Leptolyngbya sp. 7M]QYO62211.1 hypothetical protein JVX88_19085 [Leptolyngbya sp. 7M]